MWSLGIKHPFTFYIRNHALTITSQHKVLLCEGLSVLYVLLQDFEGYAPECSAAVRGAFQRVQDLAEHQGKKNNHLLSIIIWAAYYPELINLTRFLLKRESCPLTSSV